MVDLSKAAGCIDTSNGIAVATLGCIPYILKNLISAALAFSGAVAVILIIVSGIKFITSRGDAKQVEGARKTMTYAILGLILIFFSFLILNLIAYITGAQCITMFGFSTCGTGPTTP